MPASVESGLATVVIRARSRGKRTQCRLSSRYATLAQWGPKGGRNMIKAMLRRAFLPLALTPLLRDEEYTYGPDSSRQPGVPTGKVTKYAWTASTIYPGTTHDYWVYVPAQYDAAKPAAVMVFQDGATFVNENGNFRVPIVFDNLIHKKEMPVTIGILVSPGILPARSTSEQA